MILENWLHKSGAWLGGFSEKKRYFVLDTKLKQIRWYLSSSKTELRGVIDLEESRAMLMGGASFELSTPHMVYELRAEFPEVAIRWVDALTHPLAASGSERPVLSSAARSPLKKNNETEVRAQIERGSI